MAIRARGMCGNEKKLIFRTAFENYSSMKCAIMVYS